MYHWRVLLASKLPLLAIAALLFGCSAAPVGSIGAVIGVDNETGAIHVRETREGLAAEKAGLQPGDEIVMIDGVYVRDMSATVLQSKLRGDVGTKVDLTVVRGEQALRVTLVRQPLVEATSAPKPREERIAP